MAISKDHELEKGVNPLLCLRIKNATTTIAITGRQTFSGILTL